MRIALFEPDIPQNLGAFIRLSACLAVPLEIIEPCGFPLDDKRIRRASMDSITTSPGSPGTPPGRLFAGIAAPDGWSC